MLLWMLGLDGRDSPETLDLEPDFQIRAVEAKTGRPLDEYINRRHRWTVTTRHPDASGPRLLLIRDSFGDKLLPYFSETFARVRYEWPPPLSIPKRYRGVAQSDRPALVIQEFAEKALEESPLRISAFGKLEGTP